jgi:hypothetical protein
MKEARITLMIFGKELPGSWLPYDPAEFARTCTTFAANDVMFTAEFRYV